MLHNQMELENTSCDNNMEVNNSPNKLSCYITSVYKEGDCIEFFNQNFVCDPLNSISTYSYHKHLEY